MNPVIVESELHKAYANYYTHTAAATVAKDDVVAQGRLQTLYDRLVKRNYWALRYGYAEANTGIWSRPFGLLVYLVPHKSFYLDTHVMFLPAVKGGRVLDVGCGNGERLALLKTLGWNVKGIDPDREAVEKAKQMGLDADCADPKAMDYPNDSFDAVISSHVIEHSPQPLEMLAECARVLKPGGRLVVVTPNAESFGLEYYGRCWRGLEPPRHLQIFSRPALEQAIKQVGLNPIRSRTLLAPQILCASHALKTGIPMNNGATRLPWRGAWFTKCLALVESLLLCLKPNRGEIVAVIATK